VYHCLSSGSYSCSCCVRRRAARVSVAGCGVVRRSLNPATGETPGAVAFRHEGCSLGSTMLPGSQLLIKRVLRPVYSKSCNNRVADQL
jgi:hypothetical protein